ncbi:hypothetical protein BK025_13265 [Sodalis sp. TME1]|nr:hypothetical protein BK025_13265 [Sodalis sp. TME1]
MPRTVTHKPDGPNDGDDDALVNSQSLASSVTVNGHKRVGFDTSRHRPEKGRRLATLSATLTPLSYR